jgi:hypothetical protein
VRDSLGISRDNAKAADEVKQVIFIGTIHREPASLRALVCLWIASVKRFSRTRLLNTDTRVLSQIDDDFCLQMTNIHMYIVFIYQMTDVLCIHKRVYIAYSESLKHLDFLVADCQGSICDHKGFDQGISRRVPRGQIRSLRFRV